MIGCEVFKVDEDATFIKGIKARATVPLGVATSRY